MLTLLTTFLFSIISLSHAQENVIEPTVSEVQMLESRIHGAAGLGFEDLRNFYKNKTELTFDCLRVENERETKEEVLILFKNLIPLDISQSVQFSVEDHGDGFNILAAKVGDEFKPENILQCDPDENFLCPSLKWNPSSEKPLNNKDYVPMAKVSESYEFYAGSEGRVYLRYGYTLLSFKKDFFGRETADLTYDAQFICQER